MIRDSRSGPIRTSPCLLQHLRKFCPTDTTVGVPVSIRKPGFASSTAAPARNNVALKAGFRLEN
jgi:hypothetical protein